MNKEPLSIVMLRASGAVGGHALQTLLQHPSIDHITILGRTLIPNLNSENIGIIQHKIDIFEVNTYQQFVERHTTAICTLGVGEPSKTNKEDFIKIDKTAVLNFAKVCKESGINHFELLSSVGANASSSSFYLKVKGELIVELESLNFDRLSIFQPSMILTPINRYGFSQGIILKVWPILKPLLFGKLKKYRGVPVEILGRSMALNIFTKKLGIETLHCSDFYNISR